MSAGKWLRERREALGLTQGELAERSGWSLSYISAVEREEPNAKDGTPRRPRLEKVDRLARALEVGLDEARGAFGYASAGFMFRFGEGLIGFDDLTPQQQQAVIQATQTLIDAMRQHSPQLITDHPFTMANKPPIGALSDNDKRKRKTG